MTPQKYRTLIGAGLAALLAGGLLLAQRDGRMAASCQRMHRPQRTNHEDQHRLQRLSDSHESSGGEQ